MKTIDEVLSEFVKEINEEYSSEFNGRKWSGNIGTEMIKKIHYYINRRYGLDTVSGNDKIDDVKYDKLKQSYIITFEKTAIDPVTKKPLSYVSIPQKIIDNQDA